MEGRWPSIPVVFLALLLSVFVTDALIINSPSSLAGVYLSRLSSFGPLPALAGMNDATRNIQVVVAAPQTACAPLTGPQYNGTIVFVIRGACAFTTKVQMAEAAGAVGVIIGDIARPRGPAFYPGGAPNSVQIPSVVISTQDSDKILSVLTAGTPSVYATFQTQPLNNSDFAALKDFYRSIGGASGIPSWANLTTDLDPCQHVYQGVGCDMFGNLIWIEDTTYGLASGTFNSTALKLLRKLQVFALLGTTNLIGTLDDDLFQNMTELDNFKLFSVAITGPIPSSLSGLSSLYSMGINARLNGTIPNLAVPGIYELDFSANQLTGSVPESLLTHPTLSVLRLQSNRLSGTLTEISSPSLTDFNVASNQLSGEILIPNNTMLTSLNVANNRFSGKIPIPSPSLTSIDFSYNQFTSFDSVLNFPEVTNLDFSGNAFPSSQRFPDLRQCVKLTSFSATGTLLSGPINISFPDSIQELHLSNMPNLNMELTALVSTVANSMLSASFKILEAANSSLTGDLLIFDQLPTPSGLSKIALSGNHLTGDINMLSVLNAISSIDLSSNWLNGTIRDTLSGASQLLFFNASGNSNLTTTDLVELPNWLTIDYANVKVDDQRHWECPSLRGAVNPTLSAFLDTTYNDYYGCRCNENFVRRNTTCEKCPFPGECPGKEREDIVITPAGYYPFPYGSAPTLLSKCRNVSLADNPCNPDSLANFTCQEGYTDRYCSNCQEGWFHLNRRCMQCGDSTEYVSFFFMLAVLVVFIVYVLIVQQTQWRRGTFSILVFYLQISGRLLSSGVFPALSSNAVVNLVFSTSTFHLVAFECFNTNAFDYETRFYVITTAPFMIIAGLLLVYGIAKLFIYLFRGKIAASTRLQNATLLGVDTSDAKDPSDKVDMIIKIWLFRVWIYSYKLLHFPICAKVFSIFNCVDDPLTFQPYLNDGLWLPCDTPAVTKMRAAAIVIIIFYVFGSMVMFFGLLLKYRPRGKRGDATIPMGISNSNSSTELKEEDKDKEEVDPTFDIAETNAKYQVWITRELGVLYLCYKPNLYWAEIYFMLRRLALALVLSLISDESAASAAVSLIVLLLALIIHAWLKPFNVQVDNNLELMSLSIIVISYLLSILVGNIGFGVHNAGIQTTIFAFNLALLLFLVAVVLYNSRNWFSNTFGFRQVPGLKAPNFSKLISKGMNALERRWDSRTEVFSNRSTAVPQEDLELQEEKK